MDKRGQKLEAVALAFSVILGIRKKRQALCPWLFGNTSQEGKILWKGTEEC